MKNILKEEIIKILSEENEETSFKKHLHAVKLAQKDANDVYADHGPNHSATKIAHDKFVSVVNQLYKKHGKHLPKDVYDFHNEFDSSTNVDKYVKSKLNESIPSTVSRGREAVINGKKKIERAGGYHMSGKFYIGGKEVGHTENGRDYFDSDLIDKHGFMRLTNAHMDM